MGDVMVSMKTMLLVAMVVGGCAGRGLDVPADGPAVSAFTAVETSVRAKCMVCHSAGGVPPGVFVFSGDQAHDYATIRQFMTDGGHELLSRLEHHGALSMDELAAWQQWVDEGAAF